jgi:hypothetical protein
MIKDLDYQCQIVHLRLYKASKWATHFYLRQCFTEINLLILINNSKKRVSISSDSHLHIRGQKLLKHSEKTVYLLIQGWHLS